MAVKSEERSSEEAVSSLESGEKVSLDTRLTVKLPKSILKKVKIISVSREQTIQQVCEEAFLDLIAKSEN